MSFVNTSSATGQGSLSLGLGAGVTTNINELAAAVLTPATLAHVYGPAGVRRYFNQGWYGVGFTPAAGPTAGIVLITYWRWVQMEGETHLFDKTILAYPADTLYWDIPAGGVMYLEVDW